MATRSWRGDAPAVAMVVTVQITGYDAATTYKITINGKVVSTVGTGGTASTTASALQALLAASTIAEFAEVAWTVNTDTITGTANTPGVPFTATSSVSGGAGTIGAVTTATANSGPNDVSLAANWSGATLPVDTDTVNIDGDIAMLYNLDALSGVTPAVLNIPASRTGLIGLPAYNETGGYLEYRARRLVFDGATVYNHGAGEGRGTGRCLIDLSSAVASTVNVTSTGAPIDDGQAALSIVGSHASNVLNMTGGSVSLAADLGTTAQYPVIRVIQAENGTATLFCGSGCTLGAITQSGGTVVSYANVTTWTKYGGESFLYGAATLGTITQDGDATHYWYSSGTMTSGTFRNPGSVLDCTRDLRGRTATNLTVIGGAALKDRNKTITFTNPYATDGPSMQASDLGIATFSVQRS